MALRVAGDADLAHAALLEHALLEDLQAVGERPSRPRLVAAEEQHAVHAVLRRRLLSGSRGTRRGRGCAAPTRAAPGRGRRRGSPRSPRACARAAGRAATGCRRRCPPAGASPTSGARCSSRGEISSEPAVSSSERRGCGESVALAGNDIGLVQEPEAAVLLQHFARRVEVVRLAAAPRRGAGRRSARRRSPRSTPRTGSRCRCSRRSRSAACACRSGKARARRRRR